MKKLQLTGMRFGRVIVQREVGKTKWGNVTWECKCDCGKSFVTAGDHLRCGHTKSCGCSRIRLKTVNKPVRKKRLIHGCTVGQRQTPEWRSWRKMRERCRDVACEQYQRYGGRGITMCTKWNDFTAFLQDMGLKPSPQHTIDRIDNNGNYEPGNCRWATRKEQARNKRDTLLMEHEGKRCSLIEWCELFKLPYESTRIKLLHELTSMETALFR